MKLLQKNSFREAVLWVMILENLSKILGFGRNIAMATLVGFGKITDIFNYVFSTVNQFFNLFADALLAGVIPFLQDKESEQDKHNFVLSALGVFFLFFSLLALIFLGAIQYGFQWIAPGFDPVLDQPLALKFTLLLIPTAFLSLYLQLVNGYLRSEKIFGLSSLSYFVNALVGLCLLMLFLPQYQWILAGSILIASLFSALMTLILVPMSWTKWDPDALKLFRFSLPMVFGGGVGIINNFVEKGFASLLRPGELSTLQTSFNLVTQVKALIAGALIGVLFSFIAEAVSKGDRAEVQRRVDQVANSLNIGWTLTLLAFSFCGSWGLGLLFGHGHMRPEQVQQMFELCMLYLPGIALGSYASMGIQILYSNKRAGGKQLALSLSLLALTMLSNFLFAAHFGAVALVLSASLISSAAMSLCLHFLIAKDYQIYILRPSTMVLYVLLFSLSATRILLDFWNMVLSQALLSAALLGLAYTQRENIGPFFQRLLRKGR